MRVLISAAETSSDIHGAELLRAIRELVDQEKLGNSEVHLEAYGIGGPHLKKAGLEALVDAQDLLAMGSTEVLAKLPRIFRALRRISEEAYRRPPDVAVLIDYPDFHFRLAKKLTQAKVPLIYYIPPKVWVWRSRRVKFLKKFFSRILCILPFEEEFYQDRNIPVKYVGNPLVDELPLELSREEARNRLLLSQKDLTLILMPGGRPSELKEHLGIMLDAVVLASKKLNLPVQQRSLKILIPLPLTLDLASVKNKIENESAWKGLDIRISQGNAAECMVAADAGLVKSGTSTLEAGLLRCPHILVYKPSRLTAWIFKNLVRYSGPVGLVNLVAGWKPGDDFLVPEILCEKVTPERLSLELISLLSDTAKYQKMKDGFEDLRRKVCGKDPRTSPSMIAAQEVLQVIRSQR